MSTSVVGCGVDVCLDYPNEYKQRLGKAAKEGRGEGGGNNKVNEEEYVGTCTYVATNFVHQFYK